MRLPLEDQVTSLGLSQTLADFEIPPGHLEWRKYGLAEQPILVPVISEAVDMATLSGPIMYRYPAYTVAELAAMIPKKANLPQSTTLGRWYRMSELNIHRTESNLAWVVAFIQPNSRDVFKSFADVNMAEAMGEMLAWLLENELISKQ